MVDTFFCINLPRRKDRRIRAWTQFKASGLEVNRLDALESLDIKDPRGWRNVGAMACAASHRLAWKQAWANKAAELLVFEDDVVLAKDFKSRLDALKLPDDWAVCYLGCVFREIPEFVQPGLLRVGATFDMHAYIIRKSFAKILGPALRRPSRKCFEGKIPPEQRTAIDVVLSEHHKTHAAYAVWPPMAWQAEGLSNIEHSYRGNYHSDGRQRIYEEAIAHLPWPCDPLAEENATESNLVKDDLLELGPMSDNPPIALA
jgi:GR25 family glycosyltransferase involved in LPS biosynthesis